MHNEEITIVKVAEPGAGRVLTTTLKAYKAMYEQQGYEPYDEDETEGDEPFVEVSLPKLPKPLTGAAKAAAERKAKQQG